MPRKSMDGTRIHLMVTRQQYEKLQTLVEKTGLSVSELLRRALDNFTAAAGVK